MPDKNTAIKYIADKISKLSSSGRHAPIDCELLAREIYVYLLNSEKIKKMATGRCDHDLEPYEDDGFYTGFGKVRCKKCGIIKLKKLK